MNDSVTVGHRDSPKVYPRCSHVDLHGACMIGSSYLAPAGNPAHPGVWQWVTYCSAHYAKWLSVSGHLFPRSAAFRLQPTGPRRRTTGSVPRGDTE